MYNKSQLSRDKKNARKQAAMPNPFGKDVDYVSEKGYRDDSEFKDRPYIDINTPNGLIDMSATGTPLLANGRYLAPYSGLHQFDTTTVREVPLAEEGGEYMDLTDEEIEQYRAGGYVVDDLSQQDNGGVYSQDIPYPPKHNPANSFAVNDPRSMQKGGVKPYVTSDINDFKFRQAAYNDSLWLYNHNRAPIPPHNPRVYSNNLSNESIKINPYTTKVTSKSKSKHPPQLSEKYTWDSKGNIIDSQPYYRGHGDQILSDQSHSPYFIKGVPANKPISYDKRESRWKPNVAAIPFTDNAYEFYLPGETTADDRVNTTERARYKKPVQPVQFKKPDSTKPTTSNKPVSSTKPQSSQSSQNQKAKMVQVNYPTSNSSEINRIDENGKTVTEKVYYDFPENIDKSLSFTPPPINDDLEFEPPVEAQSTNPDPWNDVEPQKVYPKITVPEFTTTKRFDSKTGKWVEEPFVNTTSPEYQYHLQREEYKKKNSPNLFPEQKKRKARTLNLEEEYGNKYSSFADGGIPKAQLGKMYTRTYDPLLDYKPQVSESTKPKTVATIDKNLLKKEVVKKTEERKKVAEVVKKSPMLTDKQKTEILMSPQKLDENAHLAYQKEPDTIKQVEAPSTTERIWDIATNPQAAFEYAVRTGDFRNMPYNYNAMLMAGIDPSAGKGANLVGDALNASYNLLDAGDKVVRNIGEGNYGTAAMQGLRFLPGSRLSTGLGKKLETAYGKVATGNSFLTDIGVPAWKVERPNFAIKSSDYIARPYTDAEAKLLSTYGRGMRFDSQADWDAMEALTKSGATDFSKGNYPISRTIGYYDRGSAEQKAIEALKRGDVFTTPAEESIRTWSAGVPKTAEHLKGNTRLIIPSRYTKDLGTEFAGMPYYDKRVGFIYENPVTGERPFLNSNAVLEKELMGNIPEGFKVIGRSSEDGMNNLIIKPVKNSGSSSQFTRSGLGGTDMSNHTIKNVDYYTQLLNTYDKNIMPAVNRKFYKDLIATVKKQDGLVTQRQYNELQRLKTGNFNFGKKAYDQGGSYVDNQMTHFQNGGNMDPGNNALELHMFYDKDVYKQDGGQYLNLTDTEIEEYRKGGYVVEELPTAQFGMNFKNRIKKVFNQESTYPTNQQLSQFLNPEYQRVTTEGREVTVKPSEEQLSSTYNDFMYSKAEAESDQISKRASDCFSESGYNCAQSAFSYYDKYVAPKLPGGKSSWQLKESAGMSSGKEGANPSYNEAGESWDSWDLAGGFKRKQGKLFFTAKDNNNRPLNDKFKDMNQTQIEQYYRDLKLPIGTIINGGGADDDDSFRTMAGDTGKGYNTEQGLSASNHTTIVVGYDRYGTPYIFDEGKIHSIADPKALVNVMGITNVITPKENIGYTYDKIKKGKTWNQKVEKLNLNLPGTGKLISDIDEMKPFMSQLEKNKTQMMNTFGLTNDEYDEYAKRAVATALTETKGGMDWGTFRYGIVPSYLTDKMGIGESQGITQINPEAAVWGHTKDSGTDWEYRNPGLVKKLDELGISEFNYDPWNPNHQAIVTMGLLQENKKLADTKFKEVKGNNQDLADPAKGYYMWNSPRTVYQGEAQGDNINVKRFMEYYDMLNMVNKKDGGDVKYLTQPEIDALRAQDYRIVEE